jgi:hypothetical protein
LPWYTYPAIDFLRARDFKDREILEFGGGQSTLWWAARASHVVSFEADEKWYGELRSKLPGNVDLVLVINESRAAQVEAIRMHIGSSHFDVIAIDGLYHEDMCTIAQSALLKDGCIIADDSEGYEIFDRASSGLNRVDFYGYAPWGQSAALHIFFFRSTVSLLSGRIPIIRHESRQPRTRDTRLRCRLLGRNASLQQRSVSNRLGHVASLGRRFPDWGQRKLG